MRSLLAFALALLLAAPAAPAQIAPTSPARQRAANRRALREARRTDAPYKDSHLAVTRQQLRRGESAAPTHAAGPRASREGAAPAAEPKRLGLRLRKPKTDSFR